MPPPAQDLFLAVDVGTGSVRAALVDRAGAVVVLRAREHDQIVPQHGWTEQRPSDWWTGVVACVRAVLEAVPGASERVVAMACCGQMHGTVLLDKAGQPVVDYAPLWNDKRTRGVVADFAKEHAPETLLPVTGNPPAVAWPAFKLLWFKRERPEVFRRTAGVLIAKDYVNYRLTGERAMDHPEASTTYLYDVQTGAWSEEMLSRLGLEGGLLPPLRAPTDLLGTVTAAAARETGLRAGTPVAVGAGDFPVALLGSGVHRVGLGSDSTGTSTLITLQTSEPVLHPIISNVLGVDEGWSAFTILDAGGDAVRWARRAFHDNALSYDELVRLAGSAPAGADGLLFLPYLNGERLGPRTNARAQFFGLSYGHGSGHLHRAVMEGVAFASRRNLRIMERHGNRIKFMVASGGGAKNRLWLEIKASVYRTPIRRTRHEEAGILGCAMIAGAAVGLFPSLGDAVAQWVKEEEEILPDPDLVDRYERLGEVFDELYERSASSDALLERYVAAFGGGTAEGE